MTMTGSMMPHGMCLLWDWRLVLLHVASDLTTAFSYFGMPIALLLVRRKIDNSLGRRLFLLSASFILACGMTHVMDALVIWQSGLYWLQGCIKLATAVISVVTLWQLIIVVSALRDEKDEKGEG